MGTIVVLVVGVVFFSLASPANAQPIWILWTQPQLMGYMRNNRWLPLESFDSREACLAALSRLFFKGKDGAWWREVKSEGYWERGVCLPDTVGLPR